MRRLGILGVLGLATWGCGPPVIVPMTPPGVSLPRVVPADPAESLGESRSARAAAPATKSAPPSASGATSEGKPASAEPAPAGAK